MNRKLFGRITASILVVAHLALVSCSDDPASSKPPQQPTLPPVASMTLDLSGLSPSSTPKIAQPGLNFLNAAARVAVINASVVIVLSVPAAVFAAAFSQTPTLGSDGKYHWQYTSSANGISFTANLTGSVDLQTQESVWEMSVTSTAVALNNFLWYDGRAKLNNSSGYWDFYDPNQPNTKAGVLHLDWTYASTTDATLSFEVVKDGAPEKGDTLDYIVAGTNIKMILVDVSAAQTLEISWDRVTTAGYLIAPDYNGGQKACWDSARADVACQ
jgi:hypothetical protein